MRLHTRPQVFDSIRPPLGMQDALVNRHHANRIASLEVRVMNRSRSLVSVFAVSLVGLIALGGCRIKNADGDENQADAEDGLDSSGTESDIAHLTSSLVGENGGSLTLSSEGSTRYARGSVSPTTWGDGAKAFYQPSGCLATALDEPNKTVTYTFSDCTGPHGLLHITGQVKVVYDLKDANTLDLNVTGTDLQVNRATVDWSATDHITRTGTTYTAVWHGQVNGTTYRGRDFARTTDSTVVWDTASQCATFNGTSEGNVLNRPLKTEVKNLRRCVGECASGDVTVTNQETGATLSISLDGEGAATFTGPRGNSVTVSLACGEK